MDINSRIFDELKKRYMGMYGPGRGRPSAQLVGAAEQYARNGMNVARTVYKEKGQLPSGKTPRKASVAAASTARSGVLGVKSTGVTKPKKAKTAGGNANNEANEVAVGGPAMGPAGAKRAKKKFKPSAKTYRVGPMAVLPKSKLNMMAFQMQAIFSEAGFQSYSGGELETRAIERAVDAAGVAKIKFDRSGNAVMRPGPQIFGLTRRTFIFKPRFDLDTLKNDPHPMKGMRELLYACTQSKSKGADHVETDLIEYIPRTGQPPLIRLYELKIGEGKSEGFPAEAYQLLKSKRLLEIEWSRLYPNALFKPQIECYFLAWFFGIHPTSGTITTADVAFADHMKQQPKIHELLTQGGGTGWDRITKLVPSTFQEVSGLDHKIVTAQLIRNRQDVFENMKKILATRSRRMSIWRNVSPNTRLALETQRRRLVSGPAHRRPVPLGNLTALQEGRWGNYIRNWTADKATVPGNNDAAKRKIIGKYKGEFSRKWRQSINHLVRSGYLVIRRVGANRNASPSEMSSSASNWEKDRNVRGRLTNVNDVINKLKIVIQIMAHPGKFSSQASDFIQLRELRPVPGSLTQAQVNSIPTETAAQREWLQGFVFRAPTSAERAAAMENDAELRNLAAQSAALQ